MRRPGYPPSDQDAQSRASQLSQVEPERGKPENLATPPEAAAFSCRFWNDRLFRVGRNIFARRWAEGVVVGCADRVRHLTANICQIMVQNAPACDIVRKKEIAWRDPAEIDASRGGLAVNVVECCPPPERAHQLSTTLPDAPERIASKPCWNCSTGRRWVISGSRSSPLLIRPNILRHVSNISRP